MKYLIRSLKYFAKLCVICVIALVLMSILNMTPYTPLQMLYVLIHTAQGWVLIVAAIFLSAFYPRFGFLKRKVEGDLGKDRGQIIEAFDAAGYGLGSEEDGQLTFRVRSLLQRILLLGEDAITVTQDRNRIQLDGPGKQVVRAESQIQHIVRNR